MQLKIIKPDKKILPHPSEETDKMYRYWLACAYTSPLMPLCDLTFAFDACNKMLKRWLKKRKALAMLLLLVAPAICAQQTEKTEPLSLEEMWTVAEKNNRQLKLSDLYLQQSKLEILEAKDRLLPELSVGGDVKLNSKFLIYDNGLFAAPQDVPVKGYGYGVGYSLNFNLYNGGKDKRNIALKKEETTRKQYEAEQQKHRVKYDVAVAYFDLYKFLHFHDFLDAEIEAEQKQMRLIESLHTNGTVLKSDVLRTSVKLTELQLNLSDVTKKIEIAKQRLNILMGRANDAALAINYTDSAAVDGFEDDRYTAYVDLALNQSPAYKIAHSDIKWSELNVRQMKAMVLPQVSLYAHYNYTYPQISFYPYSNDLWGFGQTGIKVQYAIDNLFKSKHTIAHAQVLRNEAQEKANLQKDEIYLQVKEAYLQRQQALERVKTAEQNILKTRETVRVIRSSYLNQESLLTDLMEAENALLEAKFNRTTAQTNVKLSHIRLLAIVGIL
ncbi:TolC family protein [uncultured Sphingobacterium sp.]|uniref:TolC family protein n=1 Tax=uncultured Sphingobacterium sp. TaxID=182688 RepID=UPI0025E6046F|nr:TolC family protein [uncultured Sphingobacterium sp.]